MVPALPRTKTSGNLQLREAMALNAAGSIWDPAGSQREQWQHRLESSPHQKWLSALPSEVEAGPTAT